MACVGRWQNRTQPQRPRPAFSLDRETRSVYRRAACAPANKCLKARLRHDAAYTFQRVQRAHHRRILCAYGARVVAYSQSLRRDQFRPWRVPGDRRLSRLHAYTVYRLLGRAGGRACADRDLRSDHRACADPSALWPRPAIQPAAHLRPCLHVRRRHPLHLGTADPALLGPRLGC